MAGDDDVVSLPRFFKVFFSASSFESMAIPLSFMEHLEDPLPKIAKLQGTGGKVWTVGFTKIREYAYFTDGWSNFAEEHTLQDGEFLTFVYDGHCTFEVSVFGRCSCKEIRAAAEVFDVPDSESEEEEEEEVEETQEDEEEEDETSMDVDDVDFTIGEEEISQSIHPLGSEETATDAAVFVASSEMEIGTSNPRFNTVLKNRMYELLIPAETVRTSKLKFGEKIRYIDKEGSLVGLRRKGADDRMCFKGWDRICRRNRIKPQDVVTCELLHDQNVVHSVKIHISRGSA